MADGNLHGAGRLFGLSLAALAGAGLTWGLLNERAPAPAEQSTAATPKLGGDVIAIVDGQPILREAWQHRVGDVSPQQSRQLLKTETHRLAVLAEAQRAGYGEREEVRRRFEEAVVALYLRESLATDLDSVTVSDGELDAYLADHPIAPPESLRRAAILRRTPTADEDVEAIAQELLSAREDALASNGRVAHFGSLATRLSDHVGSRARGGVIGYFNAERSPHDDIPAAVHDALWGLEAPGDISEVVIDDGAMYLVRFVDEHVRRGQEPEVQRVVIRERLLQEKRRVERQRILDRIERSAGVAIAPDWRAAPVEESPPRPPASPIAAVAKSPETPQ